MKDIIPLEYAGQRVLTRPQIAALLECNSADQVRNAIRNHRSQFVKGVHFFDLTGVEVSQFKNTSNYRLVVGRFTSQIVLWTKAGVELICKFFNTPKAAQVYDELEREYFTAAVPSPATAASPVVTIDLNRPHVFEHPQFGKLRCIIKDGAEYFVAKDVAIALGYKEPEKAVREHVPDKFKGVSEMETPGGVQSVTIITEAGLYKLVMRSKMPKAEEFSDWVCADVLVSLRKKGYYALENPLPPTVKPKRKPRPRSELAHTYAFLMDNTWVKIGHSGEIDGRIKKVEYESNLRVVDEHHTPKMKRSVAMRIEHALHRKFAAQRLEGEFFNVPFEEVKAELDNQSCLLAEEIHERITEPIDTVKERAKLLVEMLHAPIDSPFKEQLAKETANLLLGEKIF